MQITTAGTCFTVLTAVSPTFHFHPFLNSTVKGLSLTGLTSGRSTLRPYCCPHSGHRCVSTVTQEPQPCQVVHLPPERANFQLLCSQYFKYILKATILNTYVDTLLLGTTSYGQALYKGFSVQVVLRFVHCTTPMV